MNEGPRDKNDPTTGGPVSEPATSLQLKLSIKQFTLELCRLGKCEKMTEQATLNENVSENDLNL